MKIIYGTSNPAKLSYMRELLKSLDLEIIGLNELDCTLPEVPEYGKTPLENAAQKAKTYYDILKMPVFSCDSGLYIYGIPDELQPGVHVRNVGGKHLSDEEMIEYYSGLALKYGDLTAKYKNAICLVLDGDHFYEAMEPGMESEEFLIVSRPHRILKKGFPLDSLSVDIKTGKYYYDLPEKSYGKIIAEDGFLEFFRRILG